MLKIKITQGPNREELFDALRLSSKNETVHFRVIKEGSDKPHELTVHIIGITSHYDSAGDLWDISLRLAKPFSPLFFKENVKYYQERCEFGILTAIYSTKTRQGIFTGITHLPYQPVYSHKVFSLNPAGPSKGLIKDALFSRVTIHPERRVGVKCDPASVWEKRIQPSVSPGANVNMYVMVEGVDVDGLLRVLLREDSLYHDNLEKIILTEVQIRQFVETYGKFISCKAVTYFLLKQNCQEKNPRLLHVGITADGPHKKTFSVDVYYNPPGIIDPEVDFRPPVPDRYNFVVQKAFQ